MSVCVESVFGEGLVQYRTIFTRPAVTVRAAYKTDCRRLSYMYSTEPSCYPFRSSLRYSSLYSVFFAHGLAYHVTLRNGENNNLSLAHHRTSTSAIYFSQIRSETTKQETYRRGLRQI